MLQVSVDATSANVCVGFDVLGLALDLKNVFRFNKSSEFSFVGFEEEFTFENNLVYTSYLEVFSKANKEVVPVTISFKGDIPISRGLGSSSSLIVAGVFAANYYLDNYYTKEELLDICASLEGHPDNIAPAILGGLVASYKNNDKYKSIKYDVSKDLKFIVVIPNDKLGTHEARKVLPKTLDYPSIVSNLSRIVNLPKAFSEGNISLLSELFVDKLHEPYRSKLIKEYDELNKIAKEENIPFAISGSGSAMIFITKDLSVLNKLSKYNTKVLNIGTGIKMEEIGNE